VYKFIGGHTGRKVLQASVRAVTPGSSFPRLEEYPSRSEVNISKYIMQCGIAHPYLPAVPGWLHPLY
jgi:hypothetical protein